MILCSLIGYYLILDGVSSIFYFNNIPAASSHLATIGRIFRIITGIYLVNIAV